MVKQFEALVSLLGRSTDSSALDDPDGTRGALRWFGTGGLTANELSGVFQSPASTPGDNSPVDLACVGELMTPRSSLGSCVILPGGDHALTASHVVAFEYDALWVGIGKVDVDQPLTEQHARNRKVRSITWRSGERYVFGTADEWPTTVGSYRYDRDRLAILELEPETGEDDTCVITPWPEAKLPQGHEPAPDSLLLVSGWGQNVSGNHPGEVWMGVTRCRRSMHAWRGIHARSPSDLFNGMPSSDDSGGPVFCPPLQNPLRGRHLRLVGVHSGRARPHGTPGQLGVYLPIDPIAEDWILHCIGRRQGPTTKPYPPLPYRPFILRNRYLCYTVPPEAETAFVKNRRLKLEAKGTGELLVNNTTIGVVVRTGKPVTLELATAGGATKKRIVELIGTGPGEHNYWYVGRDADPANSKLTYLVMLASPEGSDKLAIRIEAYAGTPDHPLPGPEIVRLLGDKPPLTDVEDSSIGGGAFRQDQDDEGNGYE